VNPQSIKKNGLFVLLMVLVLFRIVAGYFSSHDLAQGYFGDISQWMDAGDRMNHLQWPFRDFMALYGPLLFGFFSVGYRLAGSNWFAALFQLEMVSPVLCLCLAYYIARRCFTGFKFQALFLCGVAMIGLDYFYWSPALRVWLPLASLIVSEQAII
jgi:hypothetical protein